jgi:hypothetical protein
MSPVSFGTFSVSCRSQGDEYSHCSSLALPTCTSVFSSHYNNISSQYPQGVGDSLARASSRALLPQLDLTSRNNPNWPQDRQGTKDPLSSTGSANQPCTWELDFETYCRKLHFSPTPSCRCLHHLANHAAAVRKRPLRQFNGIPSDL